MKFRVLHQCITVLDLFEIHHECDSKNNTEQKSFIFGSRKIAIPYCSKLDSSPL
jgi:hypothetical protein